MRGFTLLELMLVLLLAGLLIALAIPAIGTGTGGLDLKTASRQLSAGLQKARALAVGERRETRLSVDVDTRTFVVSGDPKVYALPDGIEIKLFTAESEAQDAQGAGIRFFADGSSTGGRITLARGSAHAEIDVDWLTGRAKTL